MEQVAAEPVTKEAQTKALKKFGLPEDTEKVYTEGELKKLLGTADGFHAFVALKKVKLAQGE